MEIKTVYDVVNLLRSMIEKTNNEQEIQNILNLSGFIIANHCELFELKHVEPYRLRQVECLCDGGK